MREQSVRRENSFPMKKVKKQIPPGRERKKRRGRKKEKEEKKNKKRKKEKKKIRERKNEIVKGFMKKNTF